MKVAFFSTQPYDREYFLRYNTRHDLRFFDAQLNKSTVSLAYGCDAVCAFVNDVLDNAVIQLLSKSGIELIALRCAGYNNVDLIATSLYSVKVVRVPAYSPHAVAEHAVALILTLNRKTHKAYNRVREGNFSLDKLIGFDLYGKTVGVIGTGKIGEVFCHIMKGFGCRVLAFDLIANRELEAKGVEYLPLVELLPQCDIISLHCPLTDQTRHLINTDTINLMKPGVMLINTSRGALINTQATIQALKIGRIGYLGIDVYEQEDKLFFYNRSEEIIPDDNIMRLMSFPNVLVTSHQGFFTDEALTQIAQTTLQNIADFEDDKPLINKVG
ncbi:hydroxyacid dehydrogenase [Niastella yeongjuensis]|uniref:Hydroxyacid dehydrogenase n=1 Tax=Niastella yeongjuensis TaxID=354355 RepID=A0A1V9EWJ9_9BACT|nr:2-hydroxyacid dehydrogenase [Niastella yeongjuensis]OQP50513.1 hydroxyacid dehydrogenase [Niastella yeongjuensis]SEN30957.1 D-lactate dehydrogenase [Niastella yeongjuensis]